MSTLQTIIRYQINNAVRSRWILFHGLLYFTLTEGLLIISGSPEKALFSLVNVVLLLAPLISLVFGTMHLYGARSFILLMLTQPVKRKTLFSGLYVGLAAPLVATFLLGLLLPFVLHTMLSAQILTRLLPLVMSGVMLTVIFSAIAFLISVRQTDRVRGIAIALISWLAFAILYDGMVLLLVSAFSSYPIEKPLLAIMMANPIDLARISILMSFDAGALMGYTGAVFTRFFGSALGLVLTFSALLIWTALPYRFARIAFERQDF